MCMMPNIVLHARHASAHTLSCSSRPRYQLSVASSRTIPGHASSSSTGLTLDRRNGKTLSERASVTQLRKAAAAFGLAIPKFEKQHTNPSRSHSVVRARRRSKPSPKVTESSIDRSSNCNTRGESSVDLSSSSSRQASSIDKGTGSSNANHPHISINEISLDDESVGDAWLIYDDDSDDEDEQFMTGNGKTLSASEVARLRAHILEACREFDYWENQMYGSDSDESDDG